MSLPAEMVAVIPTFDPSRADRVRGLVSILTANGIQPRIVANSEASHVRLAASAVPALTFGRNLGFGETITKAIGGATAWDWLIILNDDVSLDPEMFTGAVGALRTLDPTVGIVYLDPEDERPIPNLMAVLLNISLAHSLTRRLEASRRTRVAYKSFSAVAIRRSCWVALDGFDPRLPFTYEDSDFARRAELEGFAHRSLTDTGVSHEGSSTTAKHIAEVLPVGVWSAATYARKWSRAPSLVGPALLVALLVRVLAAPLARAPLRLHYLGIARAVRTILRNEPPDMPPYAITPSE